MELAPLSHSIVVHRCAPHRPVSEQQPREAQHHYRLFSIYRDSAQTRRSYKAVAAVAGVSVHTIHTIARRRHWKMRAEAWDRFLDQEKMDTAARVRAEMN